MCEDTLLCFNALNGLPGPYIKWFLQKLGHEGLNNLLAAYEDKSRTRSVCLRCVRDRASPCGSSTGGRRAKLCRRAATIQFGWDPVFEPDEGGGGTYAPREEIREVSPGVAMLAPW